jgi:hypothetical protein
MVGSLPACRAHPAQQSAPPSSTTNSRRRMPEMGGPLAGLLEQLGLLLSRQKKITKFIVD